MAAPRPNPKDPRFRPFRIAAYAVYLAVVCVFSALIIVSVVKSVIAMSPGRPPEAETPLSERECLAGLEKLWKALEAERQAFSRERDAKLIDDAWSTFRVKWLTEKRGLESKCALGSQNRKALAEVFRRLERVQDLYTTQSVQFAGEIGPAMEGLRKALAEARKP